VGDSNIVIRHLVMGTNPLDYRLASMFIWIRQALSIVSGLIFSHVFQENNQMADKYANKAVIGKEGSIVINDKVYHQPIP
jgi:hypothetical protein